MTKLAQFKLGHSYYKRRVVFADEDGLFDIRPTKKKINANNAAFGTGYPYVARGERNNGIRGLIESKPEYLNSENTISFGQDTATMYYQDRPYFTGDKIQIFHLNPKYGELSRDIALFLIAATKKIFALYGWGKGSYAVDSIANLKVWLPVDNHGCPDFSYMATRIQGLKAEHLQGLKVGRTQALKAYLKATGLNDYEMTCADKAVLSLSTKDTSNAANVLEEDNENEQIRFKSFKIEDVFNKVNAKCKKKDFNRRKDISTVLDEEYCLPLINAKLGNNGIMYYGRKSDWNTQKMCIDVIQDGAVATGTVYAQPQPVGVLWNAYLIKPTIKVESPEALLYMAKCIEKITKVKFSRDDKAIWDRVKICKINLPVTSDGKINLDYMERYIRAIEKLTIKSVVDCKDKIIQVTRDAVG